MTKLAKNIKVGDTVKHWAYYIQVEEVGEKFQKNGKRLVTVKGNRVFKTESERKGVVNTWGKSALKVTSDWKETTKVQYY